ncbi:hypothetical protein SAMN04489761_3422 [Tenacibaculum sp. MAR_2009_124]|uniref:hypothetical protein n=1 Tax=Tenacibaculum sp. MAR_2009_124 TaxID=1250059 RepID=UPI00089584DD|nr:hypothetical protein [Tenacibaculum sp. MAR_2009_124]SEC65872.1 hypothetical protein SAMN04489761_3422 [Tenacibaculum sp. MAR_2009_124]
MKNYLNNKLNWSTKDQIQQSEAVLEKQEVTTRNKNWILYLFFILIGSFFYLHIYIPLDNHSFVKAKKLHIQEKEKRTKALNAIKEYSKGTIYYDEYLKYKVSTQNAWNELLTEKENQKLFIFDSLHQFLERFGLTLVIFVGALFNLIRSFYREPYVIFPKVVNAYILSISVFYFFWIFQKFQDVSKVSYILITLFSAFLISVAVYLATKRRKLYVDRIKADMIELAKKAIKDSQIEKRPEMIDFIEKLVKK